MMEKCYRIVNCETGEVAEVSALPQYRSYALKWFYKRACSWIRDNYRCGLYGAGNMHNRDRGVHLYAIRDGIIAYEIPLN